METTNAQNHGRRPEILAPAGDMERLKAALLYGADAVYLAGKRYGMRTAPANFDEDGLALAVRTAHAAGVRVYVTCNILPRDGDMDALPDALAFWQECGADAVIAADLGVLELAKRYAPRCAVHVSTQAGVTNGHTAAALHSMGAARVVLARELSLDEIAALRARVPAELELECFVHGSMCMAVSGRCLLSSFLTDRDANRGDCTQPCRWKYELTEEKRPGQRFGVEENEDGTFLFNANDLNMIDHVAALHRAGVNSFKIEGRAKAAYYVAVTANAYRAAAGGLERAGFYAGYRPERWIAEELDKISHRPYGTGFYFGQPSQDMKTGDYIRDYVVAAVVEDWREGRLLLSQRNRFGEGELLDALVPGRPPVYLYAEDLRDAEGGKIETAPHPTMRVSIRAAESLPPGSLLRVKRPAAESGR